MLYGAALSAVLALVLVMLFAEKRRPVVLITVALAAIVMPIWWNLILRWTGTTGGMSHDLLFRPFPISWQDTGTGIFTLAGAATALAVGACRNAQFYSRVGFAHQYRNLADEELLFRLSRYWIRLGKELDPDDFTDPPRSHASPEATSDSSTAYSCKSTESCASTTSTPSPQTSSKPPAAHVIGTPE